MSGRNRQRASGLVGEFLRDFLDLICLAENLARKIQDHLASRRDMRQVLAASGEHLDAKLILKESNLLTDTRLRSKQTLRGGRHV